MFPMKNQPSGFPEAGFFLEVFAVMKFIIRSNEDSMYVRKTVDKSHSFFKTQGKAGGA